MRIVEVPVTPAPYEVLIGPGTRHAAASVIARRCPQAKAAVVVTQQPLIDAGWIDGLDLGIEFSVMVIGEGEDAKNLTTLERLCRGFVDAGLSRHDLVVPFGGGLVSDVGGFAAACYHRGIAYLTIATTLLSQVDASIGGKTGVNLPEGKNLVGAFWQPIGVIADTDVLATLDPGEWACGRGEMAKYAFLGTEQPSRAILDESLPEQVARCAAIKAEVVAEDEREGGRRMVLNYGHTLAHAIEAAGLEDRSRGIDSPASRLRHGEAVAVGLLFAAKLAHRLARIDQQRVDLHRNVVGGFDLSGDLPAGLGASQLLAAMRRDKKAHHDLTFVLDGPDGVVPVSGVSEDAVLATLLDMGAAS